MCAIRELAGLQEIEDLYNLISQPKNTITSVFTTQTLIYESNREDLSAPRDGRSVYSGVHKEVQQSQEPKLNKRTKTHTHTQKTKSQEHVLPQTRAWYTIQGSLTHTDREEFSNTVSQWARVTPIKPASFLSGARTGFPLIPDLLHNATLTTRYFSLLTTI